MQAQATYQPRQNSRYLSTALLYIVTILGAVVTVLPFVWMIFSSFKTNAQIFSYPPRLIPETFRLDSYASLFAERPFGTWYLNSVGVAAITTIAVLFFSSLAGFAFAKYNFRAKGVLFLILIGSSMIPFQLILIPLFVVVSRLGWVNEYPGLIVPFMAPAIGIFLMRQFISQIPDDLLDAARIDGAGDFRIYWTVVVPLMRPALGTLGILTFLGSWNSFLWPLVVIRDQAKMTLPLGLSLLQAQVTGTQVDYGVIMAAATLVSVPAIIVFLLM
jgi:ABC-type glycerol-3-phosphate transport system permease component